jgi:hypothetical protein
LKRTDHKAEARSAFENAGCFICGSQRLKSCAATPSDPWFCVEIVDRHETLETILIGVDCPVIATRTLRDVTNFAGIK